MIPILPSFTERTDMPAISRTRIGSSACWRRLFFGCTTALVLGTAQASPIVDAQYGQAGVARIGATIPASEDSANVAARLPDGGMVVAGVSEGRNQSFIYLLRYAADGRLVPGFGEAGVVLLPRGSPDQIALQGSALLLGAHDDDGFFISRISLTGVVDPAFGNGGTFRMPWPSGLGSSRFVPHPDGSLLAVTAIAVDAPDLASYYRLALRFLRLDPNGVMDAGFGERLLVPGDFDPTFGNSGIVEDGAGGFAVATTLLERLPGGGIGLGSAALIHVTADATLDPGFGTGGVVSGPALARPPGAWVQQLVHDANGGWLVVAPPLLLRFDSRGMPDVGFGTAGRVTLPVEFGTWWTVVPLGGGGALLAFPQADEVARVARVDATGVLDLQYGQAGIAHIQVDGYRGFGFLTGFAEPDGGARFAGAMADGRNYSFDAAILALTAAGELVSGFGRGDGIAVWNRPEPADIDLANLFVLPTGAVTAVGSWRLAGGGFRYVLERLGTAGLPDGTYGDAGHLVVSPLARCTASPPQAAAKSDASVAMIIHAGTGPADCEDLLAIGVKVDATGAVNGNFGASSSDVIDAIDALVARSDGRVVHAFTRNAINTPTQIAQGGVWVEQTLPDGSLDPQFAVDGPFGAGRIMMPWPSSDISHNVSLALLPDGALVVGSVTTLGLVLHKLDAAGRPVTSFGQGGTVFIPAGNPAAASASERLLGIAVLEDTSLHVQYRRGIASTRALRLTASGGVRSSVDLPEHTSAATLVALADDSIVMAGTDYALPTPRAVLRRLLTNGAFDPDFGADGMFVVPGLTSIAALALASDGNLLVGGADATGGVVTRLVMNGVVAPRAVVEFHNAALDHYFVTANPAEAAAIDAGMAGPGWSRTGLAFRSGGWNRVCRFYGNAARNPATGAIYGPNSHFYTATDDECAFLDSIFDASRKSWRLESYDFLTTPALIQPGAANAPSPCPPGTLPVYRAYNRGFERGEDSNHRFTTSLAAYQATTARGWAAEGVRMCAPQETALQ